MSIDPFTDSICILPSWAQITIPASPSLSNPPPPFFSPAVINSKDALPNTFALPVLVNKIP